MVDSIFSLFALSTPKPPPKPHPILFSSSISSDGDDVRSVAVALQLVAVAVVTSGGHRPWQQWVVLSHGTRHYNNKGNLEVNRRTSHLNNNNIDCHFFVTQRQSQPPSANSLSKNIIIMLKLFTVLF